jgi:hypothetical protein
LRNQQNCSLQSSSQEQTSFHQTRQTWCHNLQQHYQKYVYQRRRHTSRAFLHFLLLVDRYSRRQFLLYLPAILQRVLSFLAYVCARRVFLRIFKIIILRRYLAYFMTKTCILVKTKCTPGSPILKNGTIGSKSISNTNMFFTINFFY